MLVANQRRSPNQKRPDIVVNPVRGVTRYFFDPELRWKAVRKISEGLHDTEHGELTYHAESRA